MPARRAGTRRTCFLNFSSRDVLPTFEARRHARHVFLTPDLDHLCWAKSKDATVAKTIALRRVLSVKATRSGNTPPAGR